MLVIDSLWCVPWLVTSKRMWELPLWSLGVSVLYPACKESSAKAFQHDESDPHRHVGLLKDQSYSWWGFLSLLYGPQWMRKMQLFLHKHLLHPADRLVANEHSYIAVLCSTYCPPSHNLFGTSRPLCVCNVDSIMTVDFDRYLMIYWFSTHKTFWLDKKASLTRDYLYLTMALHEKGSWCSLYGGMQTFWQRTSTACPITVKPLRD